MIIIAVIARVIRIIMMIMLIIMISTIRIIKTASVQLNEEKGKNDGNDDSTSHACATIRHHHTHLQHPTPIHTPSTTTPPPSRLGVSEVGRGDRGSGGGEVDVGGGRKGAFSAEPPSPPNPPLQD